MQDILTVIEAESKGVDMTTIRVCRELRKLAKLDRIQLDSTIHRNGLDKHLFSYIEYCGLSVHDYVRNYLSNLQPYMLARRKDQEVDNSFICVLDNLYRISIYTLVYNFW